MNNKAIVTVNEGRVRGIKKKSAFSGAEYYSFFGIPYGQSTAALSRFKDPVKVKPWKNVLDATTEKEGCYQFALQLERFAGSEDCLYNNIHIPKLPTNEEPLKPVIVMIHPGGFFHGSPDTFYYGSPEYVMHRDIVYVCIAYRLHILGFLNLDLEECSGNQGLKDIILGLQWIQDNIKAFGGDPDNVTLLGSSSGSAIVHSLMISPAAKGLFHKAIVMGISIFNPALVIRGKHKNEAIEIASTLGFDKTSKKDDRKLLSFFKRSLLKKLIRIRPQNIFNKNHAVLFPCSPFIITNEQDPERAVLPKPPDQLIHTTARIPLMFGICEREAATGFAGPYRHGTMENFYSSYRQNCWSWGYHITDQEAEEIKKQIDSFYLNGGSIETAPLSLKVDIQTDISYSNIYETLIDIISADLPSSVFVYKFQFEGNVSTVKHIIEPLLKEPLAGTYHAEDFSYWAEIKTRRPCRTDTLTPKTRQMIDTFTNLISTFATTGNPNYKGLNVEWKPTSPEKPCYLSISETLSMIEGKLNGERMEFWEKIQKQFKKK